MGPSSGMRSDSAVQPTIKAIRTTVVSQRGCSDAVFRPGEEALVGPHPKNGMRPIGLASKSAVTSVSAGQEPVWWAWLDLNQRPHPYQGSAPGPVSAGWRLPPARMTYRWKPLETVANRSAPMACGPNVDQVEYLAWIHRSTSEPDGISAGQQAT